MQALNNDGEDQHCQGHVNQLSAALLFQGNRIGEQDRYR
jgi:hypothetical protein